MAGRNCSGEQARSEAVPTARYDKGILDELRTFRSRVSHTSSPTQVSNRSVLLINSR